jgi:hypothetical protein
LKYQREFGSQGDNDFPNLQPGHGLGLFYIEGIGMITLQNIQDTIISLKKAPLTKEEEADLFLGLLSYLNPLLAEYLLNHFGHGNFRHPITPSRVDAWRDRHFYWRFYQPREFGFKFPWISEVDMERL